LLLKRTRGIHELVQICRTGKNIEVKMKMRSFITLAFVVLLAASGQIFGQDAKAETQLETYTNLLRKDIRSGKKQLVAANLVLNEAEAQKFWPVYDQYAREVELIYNDRIQIIKDYGASMSTLTNAQASALTKRLLDSDNALTALRKKYEPAVAKVINGKAQALFFQLDRRIGLLIDLQLAIGIPLVEPTIQ